MSSPPGTGTLSENVRYTNPVRLVGSQDEAIRSPNSDNCHQPAGVGCGPLFDHREFRSKGWPSCVTLGHRISDGVHMLRWRHVYWRVFQPIAFLDGPGIRHWTVFCIEGSQNNPNERELLAHASLL